MVETEKVKPRGLYVEEAIAFALDGRWKDAVAVNRTVLDRYGPDEDVYNRLGKALSELGNLQEAAAAYAETLKLNPLNIIAQKNTHKLSAMLQASEKVGAATAAVDVDAFTEEPGKSALTVLEPPKEGVEVAVAPGDAVTLKVKGDDLLADTERGVALGAVEAKIARRLLPLMATGNQYSAAVARVEERHIEIMIRETYQAPANTRTSSFPLSRNRRRDEFRPYAKESLLDRGDSDEEKTPSDEEETLPADIVEDSDDVEDTPPVEEDADEEVALEDEEEDDDADEDKLPEDQY